MLTSNFQDFDTLERKSLKGCNKKVLKPGYSDVMLQFM